MSLYLRQVVEDLVAEGRVDLTSCYPSLRRYGVAGDFRFIIIHRVYYPEDSFDRRHNLLMSLYALIGKISIDEPKALGLDTSVVVVERVPLILSQGRPRPSHCPSLARGGIGGACEAFALSVYALGAVPKPMV